MTHANSAGKVLELPYNGVSKKRADCTTIDIPPTAEITSAEAYYNRVLNMQLL